MELADALFLISPVTGPPQPKKKGAIIKIKQVLYSLLFMLLKKY